MTTPTAGDPLDSNTDARLARPLPVALQAARRDVLDAVSELAEIPDASLARPWAWKGGGEEEIRYGFYRIGEAFELAGIDALAASRATGEDRGRAAELISPSTAARWDLQGLLLPLADTVWDADPGGGEWTIRRTLGHVVSGQRYYGIGTAWWQAHEYRADDPALPEAVVTWPWMPAAVPEETWDGMPSEEAEAEGTPAEVRDRLDAVLDRATERLAGTPADRLSAGARWSGFAVDVGFRLGRWSSHLREHTVQVEKTLAMLDERPTEVQRLDPADARGVGSGRGRGLTAPRTRVTRSRRSSPRRPTRGSLPPSSPTWRGPDGQASGGSDAPGNADPVPAGGLGFVQGGIRGREEIVLRMAVLPAAHPEADGDRQVACLGGNRVVRDRRSRSLEDRADVSVTDVPGQHHELISAVTAQDVVPAQGAPPRAGRGRTAPRPRPGARARR